MPHIMTSIPGGTTFVATSENLDDILFRAIKLADWVSKTLIPDTLAIAPFYLDELSNGQTDGNYLAWGVFESPSFKPEERYLPGGIWSFKDSQYRTVQNWQEEKITETTIHSYYDPAAGGDTPLNPRQGVTAPLYPDDGVRPDGQFPQENQRYTWTKAPRYDDKVFEAGGLSRILVAYQRGVKEIKDGIDGLLAALGAPGQMELLNSTLGRVAARNIETQYIANHVVKWVYELIDAIKSNNASAYVEPTRHSGEGAGMWEAPRGALYHYMSVQNDLIKKYQIIIPTTWNVSPRDNTGRSGPMEKSLIGLPVEDLQKPIHALRAVHSFDPCVACSVHISEPATGKHFEVVTSPWGVR